MPSSDEPTVESVRFDVRCVVAASPGATVKAKTGRAARKFGISPRRVKALLYGEVLIVDLDEAYRIAAIRDAAERAYDEAAWAEIEARAALWQSTKDVVGRFASPVLRPIERLARPPRRAPA
jgi:hypothetical protein